MPKVLQRVLAGAVLLLAWLGAPASAQVGNLFFGAPCRALDTASAGGSSRFAEGEQRTVDMAGSCDLPADASAVFVSLTVSGAAEAGYLTLYSPLEAQPPARAVEYEAAATVSNSLAAQLPGDGSRTLRVFASSAVDVAIDVLGYAAPAASQPAASVTGPLGYLPVDGCRLADTREEVGPLDEDEDRLIAVQGRCRIPESAPLAMVNVTTLAPERGGRLELHPRDDAATPLAAISFPAGGDHAGAVPARLGDGLGADLGIKNSSGGPAHVAVDAQGYFAFEVPTAFRAVAPCRLFDTREDREPLRPKEVRTVGTASCRGSFPADWEPVAVFVNLTVVEPGEAGELVATLPGSEAPIVDSLMSFSAGKAARAHGSIVAVDKGGDFALQSTTGDAEVHVVVDVYGYFEAPTAAGAPGGSPLVLADGMHPANERGVDPNKLYAFDDITNVNLSNGNLSVGLPLGARYPVGGGLSYGLQLSYNSKTWDYRLHKVIAGSNWIFYTEALPFPTGCPTPARAGS
jgi:hypothetical protein